MKQKRNLKEIVLSEAKRVAGWGFTVPFINLVYLSTTNNNEIKEFVTNPHRMLEGVYLYGGLKAVGGAFKLHRKVKEKIYSPEILKLNNYLLRSIIDENLDNADNIAKGLYAAYKKRGKEPKGVRKKHALVYRVVYKKALADTYAAAKEGDFERVNQEWRKCGLILQRGIKTFGMDDPKKEKLPGILKGLEKARSKFQKKCTESYVKNELKDMWAKLDGEYISFGFMKLAHPNFDDMANKLKALKGFATEEYVEKVNELENEFYVVKLLNTDKELSELWDISKKTGDQKEIDRRFVGIKSRLKEDYDHRTIAEVYLRVLAAK